jgi:threonine 3-dehydrogenase
MSRLITGGTGLIGSELAHLLVKRDEEVVLFDITINHFRISDIEDKVKLVQGDLGNWSEVLNAIKSNQVTTIYHLGTMITQPSENSPWSAFSANVIGTYNILEAARLFNVKQLMYASSQATFSLEVQGEVTDTTIQRPTTFYGISKLHNEGLVRYYRNKFGLDARTVRYPVVIGPGDKIPNHWYVKMIESAVLGKQYECPVFPDSNLPTLMYIADGARAADLILQAPEENIKMVNYNVAAAPPPITPQEIEKAIRKCVPNFVVTYNPDPAIMALHNSPAATKMINDRYARQEWGWRPEYSTIESIVAAFIGTLKKHL